MAAAALAACDGGANRLRITSADGTLERLSVRYAEARTAEERRDGLRTRPPLQPDEGLVLVFPLEGEVCIHNVGVAYGIDVVFIASDDRVVGQPVPLAAEEAEAACRAPVDRVVEVRAGVAATVRAGDRVLGGP
ncbi:MAG: DUF192 domain-containing protein [Deltaproteobacteria bacterium]|nr:DUF192 domain-containing protein [Deltaproteobacteria bacterium]